MEKYGKIHLDRDEIATRAPLLGDHEASLVDSNRCRRAKCLVDVEREGS